MSQTIKESEKRILRFISLVTIEDCYLERISIKLQMDYAYLIRLCKGMVEKDWIQIRKRERKSYCHITEFGKTMIQIKEEEE